MKIGIIVATRTELRPFMEVFGETSAVFLPKYSGYEVIKWSISSGKTIYLILSGVGEIASASSTQYLIDHFSVDGVINYGVAGGLSSEHTAMKIGIVEKIVHSDFDISLAGDYSVGEYPGHRGEPFISPTKSFIPSSLTKGLEKFTCASADKFVGAGEPKAKLRREFGADICEMEAAGIVITCNRNDTPVTFIKAISDGADEDAEAFDNNVHEASLACVKLIANFVQHL